VNCKKSMQQKFVVFDMDGVIIDSERLIIRCWEKIAPTHGMENVREMCVRCIGINRRETNRMFQEHYGSRVNIEEVRSEMEALFRQECETNGVPPKPYAKELLAYLKKQGYHLGLASSTDQRIIRQELGQIGLLDYFEVVIGGDMIQRGKPQPDIFLEACRQLGADPQKTYVVEDSINGIRAAHAAGTIPLMVPDLLTPPEEICAMCYRIFQDLEAVKKFFAEEVN